MANVEKMQQVFDQLLGKYESAETSYVGTIAGGGTDYKRNLAITKQTVSGFKKRFDEAKNEEVSG